MAPYRHCRYHISSLPGAIVIAGLTGNLRCPIGVGHDEEEESAWHHIVITGCLFVIAGLTGNLLTGNLEGERCPIGVGHGKEEERAGQEKERVDVIVFAIVIAGCFFVIAGLTGNLLTGNLEGERYPIGVGHDGNMKGMTRKRRLSMTKKKEVHDTFSSLPA